MPNKPTNCEWHQEVAGGFHCPNCCSQCQGIYTPPDNDAIGRQIGELDIRVEEKLMAGTVSREDLIMLHQELCQEALELLKRKNQDYATSESPFRNFEMFGALGILVRASDKLARLRNFEERGTFSVADETLRETVLDALNYFILFYAYKVQHKK